MQNKQREIIDVKRDIDDFIFNWHEFPIDYWWRQRYNVPFGSSQHRDMNFFDMLIEYRENIAINRFKNEYKKTQEQQDDDSSGGMHLTQGQIDDDYESLDLTQFDKK